MRKIFFVTVLLLSVATVVAQRGQRIAYIDMEYILENVPEYLQAQNTLNGKVAKWRANLDKLVRHIEVLKTDLANEKAILTKDLIEEKEEEITLKQEELRRLEALYFGPNGDMFQIRKQLVKPVQDRVYNAIQNISARKKYDFVLDKSSDLVMLYSNKKYDISDLVLSTINKSKKIEERNNRKNPVRKELSEKQKEIIVKREVQKKKQLTEREKLKKERQEARKKVLEERRKARQKKIAEKRRILKEKKEAARKKKQQKKKKDN